MRSRSTTVVCTKALALLGVACCLGCFDGFFDDAPLATDRELEERFAAIRPDLEALRAMAAEDTQLVRIATDFTWLTDNVQWPRDRALWGLTDDRWSKYRELFTKVGCPDGIFKRAGIVYVICSSRGLVTSGVSKGYAYPGPVDPQRLVGSLDADLTAAGRPYFEQLRDGWFLFLD